MLTTYYHLVPRLRMSGYITLLHLYAFMVWTGTTLLFNFAYTLYVSVTSGHFELTSISLSKNTFLSKLGKCVVLWVNFWFPFFCVNIITCESFKCCVLLHIYLANGTWIRETKVNQGTIYCTWGHHKLYYGTEFK